MQSQILPLVDKPQALISKVVVDNRLVIGTTAGLVKKSNEDRIGYLVHDDITRVCIVDGHWGEKAAQIIVEHWLKLRLDFPASKKTAMAETNSVEKKIFKAFGKPVMNPNKDFTPEASFIVIQIKRRDITIVSYGDCRLIITSGDKIIYEHETQQTWLGAFSALGLRNRQSVEDATLYKKLTPEKGGFTLLYTDGIDECIYKKPTISLKAIASLANQDSSEAVFDSILEEVFAYGAKDNASLAVVES